MDYDEDKVDEMVLALLFLTLHGDGRAWKGHDWDALGRLHENGMICNPVGKAKSVLLTEEGERRCEELFRKHFLRSEVMPPGAAGQGEGPAVVGAERSRVVCPVEPPETRCGPSPV